METSEEWSYSQLHVCSMLQQMEHYTHLRDRVKSSKNTPSQKCTFLEMLLQNDFERSLVLSTNQEALQIP